MGCLLLGLHVSVKARMSVNDYRTLHLRINIEVHAKHGPNCGLSCDTSDEQIGNLSWNKHTAAKPDKKTTTAGLLEYNAQVRMTKIANTYH